MQTPIIPTQPQAASHLSEKDIAQYAHASARGVEPSLSIEQTEHLEDCPACQQAIMEAFTKITNSPLEKPLPISHVEIPTKTSRLFLLSKQTMRIVGVLLLGFTLLTAYWITTTPSLQSTRKWESPFENKKIDVDYQSWKIQGTESKTLYLSNGSYVRVPAGAFTTPQGEEARGNITIQYREMRSLSDLLSSGVPTQYDSASVKHNLATLGMFELRAWQDGQLLQLATNKTLEVNMLTSDASKGYSHYYLQERNNTPAYAQAAKWQYVSNSQMRCDSLPDMSPLALLENKKQEVEMLEGELKQNETQDEQKTWNKTTHTVPKKINVLFSLQLNEEENPGLARYHSTIWEYVGENPMHNPAEAQDWVLQEKWDDVQLKNNSYRSLSLIGHKGAVRSAVFSPDSKAILTASEDHTARIWTTEGQAIATLQGHTGAINTAIYAPDGTHILTASEDHTATIWDKQGYKLFGLLGHKAPIKTASFSPKGTHIITTSLDNTVKIWSRQGEELLTLMHHVPNFEAQFSPDGQKILVISQEMKVEMWSIAGEKIRTLQGFFGTARFSASGDFIITTSRNPNSSKAIVWATETGKMLRELSDITDGEVMFTPDEGHIFSYSGTTPRLWHWNKLKPNSTVLIRDMSNNTREKREGHTQKIRKSFFSNNGEWIMTAGADHVARIWTKNGNLIRTLREHTAPVNMVQSSPDGSVILTASDDNTAKIWRERENKDVLELVLVKNQRKLIDNKGQRYEIKGKEVHVPVRLKGEREETNQNLGIVVTAKHSTDPQNLLLERYEQALAGYKALEQLPKQGTNQLCFRQFRIRNMGVYACAKAIIYKPSEGYTLQLESQIPNKSLHLYRVAQVGGAYTVEMVQKKREVQLAKKEMLVVIFPKDQLAVYKPKDLPQDCQSNAKSCKLHLQAQAQVFGKDDLDRVMR